MILPFLANIFELAALVVSLIYLKSLKKHGWLLLPVFLLYVCITEGIAIYCEYLMLVKNTTWIYNPYIIISTGFYGWILARGIKNNIIRNFSITFTLLYCLLTAVWYLIWGDPMKLISLAYSIGAIWLILLVILLVYDTLNAPNQEGIITDFPLFWIAAGVFFFYSGTSLGSALYPYLSAGKVKLAGVSIYNLFNTLFSIILYSFIIFAIIKCRIRRSI